MYFENKNKFDEIVKVVIIREVHLIKNFKANLLIENDIFGLELIDIFTSVNTVYIGSCDVTIIIAINVKFKAQHMLIHSLKTRTALSESECLVKIYNIILSDRNYFFVSIFSVNFSIYAYVINLETNVILIRNDIKNVITISRNFRLNLLNEMNYFNVYMIDTTISKLAIKYSKIQHKIS